MIELNKQAKPKATPAPVYPAPQVALAPLVLEEDKEYMIRVGLLTAPLQKKTLYNKEIFRAKIPGLFTAIAYWTPQGFYMGNSIMGIHAQLGDELSSKTIVGTRNDWMVLQWESGKSLEWDYKININSPKAKWKPWPYHPHKENLQHHEENKKILINSLEKNVGMFVVRIKE